MKTLTRMGTGLLAFVLYAHAAAAQTLPKISLQVSQGGGDPGDVVPTLQIVGLMTLMALAPALVLMMTSFTRIIIVLHFLRQAMGTNQVPPAQLVVGLALILTFFVMQPTLNVVNDTALKPYMAKTIDQKTAFTNAAQPFKDFMLRQVRERDLALFVESVRSAAPGQRCRVGIGRAGPGLRDQ